MAESLEIEELELELKLELSQPLICPVDVLS
jgi:hypothetical protein